MQVKIKFSLETSESEADERYLSVYELAKLDLLR